MGTLVTIIAVGGIIFLMYYLNKKSNEWSAKLSGKLVGKLTGKTKYLLQNFENRISNRGFTKRIVVWDFLPEKDKINLQAAVQSWLTMGIWINYQQRLITLRYDMDSWTETDIPFDKIQDVDVG